MKLKGEGETETIIRTRVRRDCDNCSAPATQKRTYLNDGPTGARSNPASSAYNHDDCTWCSDYDLYVCDDCVPADYEIEVPEGYGSCSTFKLSEQFAHMFLRWNEQKIL